MTHQRFIDVFLGQLRLAWNQVNTTDGNGQFTRHAVDELPRSPQRLRGGFISPPTRRLPFPAFSMEV